MFAEILAAITEDKEGAVATIREIIKVVKPIIEETAVELKPLYDKYYQYAMENNVETFKFYIKNGMTRDEAIILIVNSKVALAEILDKQLGGKK